MEELKNRIEAFWKKVEEFKAKYPKGTKITEEIIHEDRLIKQEYESIMSELLFRNIFKIKD